VPAATLTELLAGLPADERIARKAEALARLLADGAYTVGNKSVPIERFTTWTIDGVTLHLVAVRYIADYGCLGVIVTAEDAGGPLPAPPIAGEHWIVNPPICVHDGETVVESIVAACQQSIYEAVVAYARNHGWGG